MSTYARWALWLLLLAAPAAGETMRWDDILNQATEKNPTLQKANEAVRQSRLSYKGAMTNFLPQLSANGAAGQSETPAGGFGRQYSYGLNGSLSLFSGFADISNLAIQDFGVSISLAGLQRTWADTIYALKQSYIQLQD